MAKQKTKSRPRIGQTNIILIIALIIVVMVASWVSLTRAGNIPNVLNIEFLSSGPPEPFENLPDYDDEADCNKFGMGPGCMTPVAKPVIYLYPQTETAVNVHLNFQGTFIATYPEYNNGWDVTASPDGQLVNKADGKPYSYLFWEGTPNKKIDWDLSRGFVVPGPETREFLQEKLSRIGLTPREYNEFIVYWYPLMKDNAYNLISFSGEQYTDTAKLTIAPTPDSILRVFMVYKPLEKKITVEPQAFDKFERKGFTVVEWGGTKTK